MKKPVMLLSSLIALALLQSATVFALDPRASTDKTQQHGKTFGRSAMMQQRGAMLGQAGKAVPFGGAYSLSQNGKRPEDLKRPSATSCALHEQTRGMVTSVRQDVSGKIQTFGDTSSNKRQKGDIYADCTKNGNSTDRLRSGVSSVGGVGGVGGVGTTLLRGTKTNSAYNRGNTLKAATDGYINRSATSSMMPKKAPTMYDPVTGTLKPSKAANPYQIYQQ